MAAITIDVPDDLLQDVRDAIAGTKVTLEHAVLMGLEHIAAQKAGGDIDQTTLDKLLDEGLNSPLIEADDTYWEKMIADFRKKHAARNKRRTA